MSACLSAWNNSVPTEWIFVKLDIGGFFENPSRKSKFHPMFEIIFRIVFFINYAIFLRVVNNSTLNSAVHITNIQSNPNTASSSFRAHESQNGSAALYSISIYHHLNIPPKILLSKQWRYIRA
jgi:hypothetical protein